MALDQIDVDEMDKEKEMTFLDHLEELRWHLMRSSIAILIGGIAIFLSGSWFFDNVILWPKSPDFVTYEMICWLSQKVGLGTAACVTPKEITLVSHDLQEIFVTHLKVSAIGGFVIAFPYVLWEIWRFVAPGLKNSERKYTGGLVWVCSLLFLMGVAFGYFIISPFAIYYLTNYEVSVSVRPDIQFSSFINSITMITLPAGIVFELPVVVYFLSKIGLVTPMMMRKYRKHAFVIILIVAAIITPPDVITQFIIGVPLYMLYEISIGISARIYKKREQELNS
ncbi:MAG: twin-arginine translocase subunit TatC [Saprospiraceae bacterium]